MGFGGGVRGGRGGGWGKRGGGEGFVEGLFEGAGFGVEEWPGLRVACGRRGIS
jgi:hypothetical protein